MTLPASLPPGYRLTAFDTIGSTNDEAKRLAAEGVAEGAVVWATTQTKGRGRQDRSWRSPPGNLYCSILLRPAKAAPALATLGFVAALAAAEAIEALAPATQVTLKWPNDILIQECKVAGILLEAGGNGAWLVIGCGINLAHFPEDTPFPATSVVAAKGVTVSASDALGVFCHGLDGWHRRWRDQGFEPIRQAWLARAHPKGTRLSVRLPSATVDGTFRELDRDGTLLLDGEDGALHRIAAGDVYFALPTTKVSST